MKYGVLFLYLDYSRTFLSFKICYVQKRVRDFLCMNYFQTYIPFFTDTIPMAIKSQENTFRITTTFRLLPKSQTLITRNRHVIYPSFLSYFIGKNEDSFRQHFLENRYFVGTNSRENRSMILISSRLTSTVFTCPLNRHIFLLALP